MTTAANSAVLFYWRPGCPFCVALRNRLRKRGIPFEPINIWEDPAAAARVRSVADGNETVPTVFVGDRAMVNPSVDQVESALREFAPHLLELDTPKRRRIWPWGANL
jgi:glutaredoxin-like protein